MDIVVVLHFGDARGNDRALLLDDLTVDTLGVSDTNKARAAATATATATAAATAGTTAGDTDTECDGLTRHAFE